MYLKNVLCIKWGSKYSADYVNKLYSMVERHLSLSHRFVCLTEDTTGLNSEIETTVTHLHRFENIYLVKGENFCDGKFISNPASILFQIHTKKIW